MPIFDDELINNKSGESQQSSVPSIYLGSPEPRSLNINLGGGLYTESQIAQGGLTLDQLASLAGGPDKSAGFDSSFQMIPSGELLENKRYPLYERGKDLENVYALNQSWAEQLGNSLAKFGATSMGTFAQSFATLPNTISAIKNGKISDLSNPDGYEASIDRWLKNLEDRFPNYYSRYEKQHPYLAMIPGFAGSANFWGNGVLKNLGFTVGAITGAIAQDAIISLATGGIGAVPAIAVQSTKMAAQIGKASLWLNKLFAGTNKIDDVITLAKGLGKTPQQLMNIEKLGQLAAATKLNSGIRYALGIYGSARTEAGVEARDGYIQVKEELINQYKLENGFEPTGADLSEIEQYATDAMNTRFGINMALLTVSNALQFDNILKSFTSAQKGVTGQLVKELQDIGSVGLVKGSLDTFEKKTAGTVAGRAWNKIRPTVGNVFIEGVYEEGGQFAAERGTYDYYTRKYKDLSNPDNKESWNSLNEIIDSTVYGLSEQFGTTEGVTNMMIGGITALITGGIQGRVDVMKGRGRNARLNSSLNILNRYGMTGILADKYDNTLNSIGIAREMQEAARSGDVFKYKNLKSDEFFTFVQSRIPPGLHDVTIEQLNMLKDLDKDEFEKTFGLDFNGTNKKTVSEYVDSLISTANNIKSTYDVIDKSFKNPFKSVINPKTDEEAVENDNHDTFEKWKTEITYYSTVIPDQDSRLASIERDIVSINPLLNNGLLASLTSLRGMQKLSETYMNEAQRLEQSINELTTVDEKKRIREDAKTMRSNAQKINNAIKSKNNDATLSAFGDILNFELNNRDSSKAQQITKERITELYNYGYDINRLRFRKERASKILDGLISKEGFNKFFEQEEEVVTRRKKFMEEYADMKENPHKYHEISIQDVPEEQREPEVKTVKIKTATGEKDIEVGTEYFLGKVVEHDKYGNEVYRAPRLKILSVSEDGKKVTIQDTKGVREIDAELLEDYKLGKVSTVRNNPTAQFFMTNWNTVIWQKLKGGKRQKGRLEYDSAKNQLYFSYRKGTKGKGYTKRFPIDIEDFEPKGQYLEGRFTTGKKLTADEKGWIERQKELKKTPEKAIIYKLNTNEGRKQVVTDLYNELKERKEKTNKLIENHRKNIQDILDDIDELNKKIEKSKEPVTVTKKGTLFFKPSIKKAMDAVKRLNKAKEEIESEIQELEIESNELDIALAYLEDAQSNIAQLDIPTKDIVYELGYEIELIKEGMENTAAQIDTLGRLVNSISSAIEKAINLLVDFVNEFKSKYPKVPARMGQEWVDFIKANPNFLKKKPDYAKNLNDLEQLIAVTEDFEITPNQEKLNKLLSEVTSLEQEYERARKELIAKQIILDKFQKAYQDYVESGIEEKKIENDKKLIEAALGTADKTSVPTREHDDSDDFEPDAKKADNIIWRATMGITRMSKPHQIRANKFGFNFNKFENKDDIRGVYITSQNEKLLGLDGLMDFIVDDAKQENPDVDIDKNDIIALVMVDVSGEEAVLINENGEPLEGNPLDGVIYQVFPRKELRWSKEFGEGSMFRSSTSDADKTSILEYYAKFRKETIEKSKNQETKEDLSASYTKVSVSFGFPDYSYVMGEDGKPVKNEKGRNQIDYKTRTSVEDAGLATEFDFDKETLIYVPTLDTGEVVTNGTTSYKSKMGVPFFRTPSGDVPLQSRKHTRKEAETIFNVIHLIAKNMVDPDIGFIDKKTKKINERNLPLVQWLESVVYWGHPVNQPGYSSVFWKVDENGKFVLEMSGKGETFPFTPKDLDKNRDIIIGILENMYINVKKNKIEDLNEPYTEFLSVDDLGNIESRRWINYQAFLLSNKFIAEDENDPENGKAIGNVPLTTVMKPLVNEDSTNRNAIYFITEDNSGEVVLNGPEKKIVAGKPSKKKEKEKPAPEETKKKKTVDDETLKNEAIAKAKQNLKAVVVAYAESEEAKTPEVGEEYVYIVEDEEGNENEIYYTLNEDGKIMILPKGDVKAVLEDLADKIFDKMKGTKPGVARGAKGYSIADLKRKLTEEAGEEEEVEEIEAEEVEPKEETPAKEKRGFKVGDLKGKSSEVRGFVRTLLDEVKGMEDNNKEEYRIRIEEQEKKFEKESWPKIESWLKTNFPNVPVYRVKNIIRTTNGKQAWGMFKDVAIYVYENAEVGTIYHEVFEVVWKSMASPEEQQAIIDEFKRRRGMFTDRPTGNTVRYSEATSQQIKEQLAEEFRDYVQYKKIPPKPDTGRPFILKLFSDLVNIIRKFFFGEHASKVEEMFNNINTGFYKNNIPYASNLSFGKAGIIDIDDAFASSEDELREKITDLSDKNVNDILQSMTYYTIFDLIEKDENLFNLQKHIEKNKVELYEYLLKRVAAGTKGMEQEQREEFMEKVVLEWENIVRWHQELLRQYDIEFDENDEIQIKDENKIRESDFIDATKIDHLKKASSAIKMMLSTIPELDSSGVRKVSSVGGPVLIPLSKVWASLLRNLHNATSVEDMVVKLREMAKNDPNYRGLYKRIVKRDWSYEVNVNNVDLSHIRNKHSQRLLASFYTLMKKSNPEVKTITIFDNGEISVGDTHLSTFAAQLRDDYVAKMVLAAKNKSKYFKYDSKNKVYSGNKSAISATKLDSIPAMIKFLSDIGIVFDQKQVTALSYDKMTMFKEAVAGIRKSIYDSDQLVTISGKVLKMNNRLLDLAYVQASINNPEFDTTFFNVNNERTQGFIGTNPASDLYHFISQLDKFSEKTLMGTHYSYLWTDSFAKGSDIIKRMFARDGSRMNNDEAKKLLSVAYISGIDNIARGRRRESAKLTQKERMIQELNINLKGYYLNLVPGDASMEHAIYMGEAVSLKNIRESNATVNLIFKNYFISELDLVRENELRENSMAKFSDGRRRNSKEMRFFKAILGDKLHSEVLSDKSATSEEVYKNNEFKINRAVSKYISDQNHVLKEFLTKYGILRMNDNNDYTFDNVDIEDSTSDNELNKKLTYLNVNYMIANIELHKLLYSDPYQYADELKRIKNFLSPRQSIVGNSRRMNALMNRIWNEGFVKNGIGWTDFTRDHFRTTTYKDIQGISTELEDYMTDWKETDGAGIITFPAYRHFRIRAGNWGTREELQYIHDMGYEQLVEEGATEEELLKYEESNPHVQSAYVNIKPIVSGTQVSDVAYNKIVLDKYALYPMSRRLADAINRAGDQKTSNMVKLYQKMINEKIDYVVFENSRKVGAASPQAFYDGDGNFNTLPYTNESIVNVPFSIMSIQSEVPSKDIYDVTRGTQITKLITMDLLEAGVPIDFDPTGTFEERFKAWTKLSEDKRKEDSPLYAEIMENQKLLEGLITIGYYNTLKRLGITETYNREKRQKEFSIADRSLAHDTLMAEILKREVSDNIIDALKAFIDGKSVLEATPAYQQIRNIIYSIADKEIMSQKINGAMKVQVPSSALEEVKAEEVEINGKKGYVSDTLSFYKKDGKNVCGIMIARWFDSNLSDKELLDYLNNTKEGQKILSGVAYRIPTQKQNSIESFVVERFLPKEFGDSVVVPSAIVQKTGSDFDIDKLTIYLKNIFKDKKGDIRLIPYFGVGNDALAKMKEFYKDVVKVDEEAVEVMMKILKQDEQLKLFGDMTIGRATSKTYEKWLPIFKEWFEDDLIDGKLPVRVIDDIFMQRIERLSKKYEDLTNEDLQDEIADRKAYSWYRKSLENRYIESMQKLTSDDANFERLTTPNSADQLKALSKKISKRLTGSSFDYEDVGNMLDRTFMTRLRHAFVTGKYAIGITAVNQTNHSLNQRQFIFIDPRRLSKVSDTDKMWLDDAIVRFRDYNKVKIEELGDVAVMSMSKNADGQYISDIISQFIDGYVDISKGPWIMEMGATPNVVSTWLFLVKIGVPIDTIAYFMNQPIIRDYLRSIEVAGYSWLFMEDFVESTFKDYADKSGKYETIKSLRGLSRNFKIPATETLERTFDKESTAMSDQEKIEQKLMLVEFLKYAKMAEHLFHVTQGSNFDTANFNDPFLIFKKFKQLEKAQKSIISDVDKLLSNSFIGKLSMRIKDIRNALAEILESDKKNVRRVAESVLESYTDMNDKDFVHIAQKVINDIIDYAVQVTTGKNEDIFRIMIEKGGVANDLHLLMKEIEKDPTHVLRDNHIVGIDGILKPLVSPRAGDMVVNNVSIRGLQNKVYDQNMIIWAFREIKDYLKDKSKLYNNIVELAILQSGLSRSSISFTSVIPYEDFEAQYHSTLSKLNEITALDKFIDLGVFYRNNWNNDHVMPSMKAAWIDTVNGKRYNPAMWLLNNKDLKKAVEDGNIPPVMAVRSNTREANSDYIVYSWEKEDDLLPENWKDIYPKMGKRQAVRMIKSEMREKADYSYINKGLFRKVKDSYGNPLLTGYKRADGEFVEQHLYVAINAWGDGRRANEFYDHAKKSVIDNGFIKVNEVSDDYIISIDSGMKPEDVYDIIGKEDILEDYSQATGLPLGETIHFEEDTSSGYAERTKKNASADATIAIAANFSSAGEKLTKNSVIQQGKKYIAIDANKLTVTKDRVNKIVEQLNSVKARTLNIAGNGIYTLKGKYTQEEVDEFTYKLLKAVVESPELENKILSIRTGGQTGFDEAGAKAGMRLGIPTMILAPKGWKFRNTKGQDISDEKAFKDRFKEAAPTEKAVPFEIFKTAGKITHVKLKNGKKYKVADVKSAMMEKMGYNPAEIGKILKKLC
ncbi:MAG: putative molybdenum carrier [Parcubacteria group bacterium ADurb.Bin216]|nr:MAG: putative molybdenum carrier [Parcubacteria group bacterium ADurb.Bin216]